MTTAIRRTLASVGATGALVAGTLAFAGPAQAAPVVLLPGGALVDVTIIDFVDVEDVVVQLPVSIALNVCNTTIALLSDVNNDGVFECTATSDSRANNRR